MKMKNGALPGVSFSFIFEEKRRGQGGKEVHRAGQGGSEVSGDTLKERPASFSKKRGEICDEVGGGRW